MKHRRTFIGSLALATFVRLPAAVAQSPRKVHRIGIMGSRASTAEMVGPQPRDPYVNALLLGLREQGYVYGEHFVTEPRGPEGKPERFPSLVAELVGLQVDVIVAGGPVLPALKQGTSTIPVVMTGTGDPVAQGFARSLARPGGNFTGLSLQGADITGKRLELLKALVPAAEPVAVLWGPRVNVLFWQAAEAEAREQRWKVVSLEVADASEIERAFRAATDARAAALLVLGGAVLDPHARRIAELAARSRLPAMYPLRFYVEAGGLMSYGADTVEPWRRAAVFVDKILKGARPADIPIEQPTKFDLVINLKAAKSIGLTIPPSFLSRADAIVQ